MQKSLALVTGSLAGLGLLYACKKVLRPNNATPQCHVDFEIPTSTPANDYAANYGSSWVVCDICFGYIVGQFYFARKEDAEKKKSQNAPWAAVETNTENTAPSTSAEAAPQSAPPASENSSKAEPAIAPTTINKPASELGGAEDYTGICEQCLLRGFNPLSLNEENTSVVECMDKLRAENIQLLERELLDQAIEEEKKRQIEASEQFRARYKALANNETYRLRKSFITVTLETKIRDLVKEMSANGVQLLPRAAALTKSEKDIAELSPKALEEAYLFFSRMDSNYLHSRPDYNSKYLTPLLQLYNMMSTYITGRMCKAIQANPYSMDVSTWQECKLEDYGISFAMPSNWTLSYDLVDAPTFWMNFSPEVSFSCFSIVLSIIYQNSGYVTSLDLDELIPRIIQSCIGKTLQEYSVIAKRLITTRSGVVANYHEIIGKYSQATVFGCHVHAHFAHFNFNGRHVILKHVVKLGERTIIPADLFIKIAECIDFLPEDYKLYSQKFVHHSGFSISPPMSCPYTHKLCPKQHPRNKKVPGKQPVQAELVQSSQTLIHLEAAPDFSFMQSVLDFEVTSHQMSAVHSFMQSPNTKLIDTIELWISNKLVEAEVYQVEEMHFVMRFINDKHQYLVKIKSSNSYVAGKYIKKWAYESFRSVSFETPLQAQTAADSPYKGMLMTKLYSPSIGVEMEAPFDSVNYLLQSRIIKMPHFVSSVLQYRFGASSELTMNYYIADSSFPSTTEELAAFGKAKVLESNGLTAGEPLPPNVQLTSAEVMLNTSTLPIQAVHVTLRNSSSSVGNYLICKHPEKVENGQNLCIIIAQSGNTNNYLTQGIKLHRASTSYWHFFNTLKNDGTLKLWCDVVVESWQS